MLWCDITNAILGIFIQFIWKRTLKKQIKTVCNKKVEKKKKKVRQIWQLLI